MRTWHFDVNNAHVAHSRAWNRWNHGKSLANAAGYTRSCIELQLEILLPVITIFIVKQVMWKSQKVVIQCGYLHTCTHVRALKLLDLPVITNDLTAVMAFDMALRVKTQNKGILKLWNHIIIVIKTALLGLCIMSKALEQARTCQGPRCFASRALTGPGLLAGLWHDTQALQSQSLSLKYWLARSAGLLTGHCPQKRTFCH